MHPYFWPVTTDIGETPVTKMKALSAAIFLSAALAAPVFAQDAISSGYALSPQHVINYRSNYQPYDQNFNGSYNQSGEVFYAPPLTSEERENLENFGFSGRDPSRVGGENPYLHPGG
jgi:hypothetical protein